MLEDQVVPNSNYSILLYCWPGRNRPACAGRFLLGPDQPILTLSSILILAMPMIWAWIQTWSVWRLIILAVIPIGILEYLLLRASLTDPGIIPRSSRGPNNNPVGSPSNEQVAPTVPIGDHQISLNWCYTCLHWKPVRCHHCKEIDCCVLEMDHYCPWVSNCIGLRNYRPYVLFVCLAALMGLYYFIDGVLACINLAQNWPTDDSKKGILTFIHVLITFFLLWALIPLSFYHAWLMATGKTTAEHVKGIDIRSLYNPPRTCLQNYISVFTRKTPASLIDFNAICDSNGRLVKQSPIIVIESKHNMAVIPESN